MDKTVFQKELERSVFRNIVLIVVFGCMIFCGGIWTLTFAANRSNGMAYLDYLEKQYRDRYERCWEFLKAESTVLLCEQALNGENHLWKLVYEVSHFNAIHAEKANLIVTDSTGNIILTTFDETEVDLYLQSFNYAACQSANVLGREEYHTIYYVKKNQSRSVYVYPIMGGDEVRFYISMYLEQADWDAVFPTYQYDGVITTAKGNAILCSNNNFLDAQRFHKFALPEETYLWEKNGVRYLIYSRNMDDCGAIIYAMIYYPENKGILLVGSIIIAVIGSLWYGLAKRMSVEMANKNAASIGELINEIRQIRKGDYDHQIQVPSQNEYGEVARQINRMLDSIKALNEEKAELIEVTHLAEFRQLTAQINPHFMYNTLDTIKYMMITEPQKAQVILEEFTQILRYSIDNTKKEVLLGDDMVYICNYLNIQKERFSERFTYEVRLDETCESCRIPKLLLQPLIENSIKYGFQKKMELHIAITGICDHAYLKLTVADNGGGMRESEVKALRTMIGLRETNSQHNGLHNISRRLKLQYGRESRLEIENREGEGFTVVAYIRQEDE